MADMTSATYQMIEAVRNDDNPRLVTNMISNLDFDDLLALLVACFATIGVLAETLAEQRGMTTDDYLVALRGILIAAAIEADNE